jgi:hypothetical protein
MALSKTAGRYLRGKVAAGAGRRSESGDARLAPSRVAGMGAVEPRMRDVLADAVPPRSAAAAGKACGCAS